MTDKEECCGGYDSGSGCCPFPKDELRGHRIKEIDGQWYYCDTGEPTVGNVRPCGYCGMENTPEGHDGCLGTLPGVMNACCGHGIEKDAYIQFWNGEIINGKEAIDYFKNETR